MSDWIIAVACVCLVVIVFRVTNYLSNRYANKKRADIAIAKINADKELGESVRVEIND